MVSKLVFKGDKKKKKKSKRSRDDEDGGNSTSKKSKGGSIEVEEEGEVNMIAINNKFLRIDELDIDSLDAGWTSATSIKDLNGPIMITRSFIDPKTQEERIGTLIFNSLDEASISHDLSIADPKYSINYTPDFPEIAVDLDSKVQRIEPTDTNQVFVIMNIESLLKETLLGSAKQGAEISSHSKSSKPLVLKNSEGKYLSYDSSEGKLSLSEVITATEILRFQLHKTETGYQWFIYLNDEKMKLTMDKEFKIKIVRNSDDDDDNDDDGSSSEKDGFTIRIQLQNSEFTKRCIHYHTSQTNEDQESNEMLNNSIKKLMDDKISITNSIMKRLQKAVAQGNVNEVLIDIKEKQKSDSRC